MMASTSCAAASRDLTCWVCKQTEGVGWWVNQGIIVGVDVASRVLQWECVDHRRKEVVSKQPFSR